MMVTLLVSVLPSKNSILTVKTFTIAFKVTLRLYLKMLRKQKKENIKFTKKALRWVKIQSSSNLPNR